MWVVATDRVAWSICLSVGHVREPYKNDWTNRDAVWGCWLGSGEPKEPCVNRRSRSLKGNGQFLGVVQPIEKQCESLLQCKHQKSNNGISV